MFLDKWQPTYSESINFTLWNLIVEQCIQNKLSVTCFNCKSIQHMGKFFTWCLSIASAFILSTWGRATKGNSLFPSIVLIKLSKMGF